MLLQAFLIGLGFGFFLERAGLGDSRKLAAQFYGTDMTVFKVMFTAIITAMLGLFWLTRFGIVDPAVLTPLPTFAVPQLVGGLIFGLGFIVGGYCPGTSCVAFSLGRGDGMSFLGGILAGMLVYHLGGAPLSEFAASSSLGNVTLSELLGISYPGMVLLVSAGAIAAFWGAEWIEKKLRRSKMVNGE